MYDLFISFKSEDKEYAERIRKELLDIDETLRIFWSEVSLGEIGISDFSQVIEDAIEQSKNMVVVGTSVENITSPWVTYEWRLFRNYQLNDSNSFYKNLFLATNSIDIRKLPGALQVCECLQIDDFEQIHCYAVNRAQEIIETTQEKRGLELIQKMFETLGWKKAIFFSPEHLSEYERSIQNEVKVVTVISHSLLQDSPGGALFNTVENNLKNGVKYNYIFLDSSNAYGLLRKIIKGHSEECRKNLMVETAEDSFWIFGNYSNITVYEFGAERASEGYLRVLIETSKGHESPVYLRMSEPFVDSLWNHIEDYRMRGLIKKYGG